MDYSCCICLDHFSEEEKRRLENELELSTVVQRGLLPQELPEIAGVQVAAFSRPAQIIGGDYFDFFRFQDGAHGLAIADVAGKGVSAGMIMASIQTALRALVPTQTSPAAVLEQVNRLFLHNVNFTTFITLFLAHYDPATRELTYSNAGHNPPLLSRADHGQRSATWLRPTGAAIGLVEGLPVYERSVSLEPNDVLVLYTDGVTELFSPQDEQFGEDRLAELFDRQSMNDPGTVVQTVRLAMDGFRSARPVADDVTLVVYAVGPDA
jgi:sigma-B regulation protein RsbU (phosphoserine phosphatase)